MRGRTDHPPCPFRLPLLSCCTGAGGVGVPIVTAVDTASVGTYTRATEPPKFGAITVIPITSNAKVAAASTIILIFIVS